MLHSQPLKNTSGAPDNSLKFIKHFGCDKIELNWVTEPEANIRGIIVEKKINDTDFFNLAFIPGQGKTNQPRQYYFTDSGLKAGSYTYRLKFLFKNGAPGFSDVIRFIIQ